MSPKRKKAERLTVISVRLTKKEGAKLKAEHRELWPSLSWSAFLRVKLGVQTYRVPVPFGPTTGTIGAGGGLRWTPK